MGGKGSTPVYQPPSTSSSNDGTMMALIMQMMAANNTPSQESVQAPPQIEMPEIVELVDFNWAEKQKELNQMAKAEYAIDQRRRKGHEDTLHAPLIEDEELSLLGS